MKMDDERLERLLDASIAEFNSKTFNEASLNIILKNAKISKGSFYYNFQNKSELYVYIYQKLMQYDMSNYNDSSELSNISFGDLLRMTAEQGIQLCKERPEYLRFYKKALLESEGVVKTKINEVQSKFIEEFVIPEFVIPGISSGEFRSDLSLEFYSAILSDMTKFVTEWVLVEEDDLINEAKTEKRIGEYIDFFERGIIKR